MDLKEAVQEAAVSIKVAVSTKADSIKMAIKEVLTKAASTKADSINSVKMTQAVHPATKWLNSIMMIKQFEKYTVYI